MESFGTHYKVKRRLGAGGMSEVFLAYDTELDRDIALKVLLPELAADEEKRKRFRAATKASSCLSHPNICTIHEVGESTDRRPYIAMEYVEGEPLDQILQRRKPQLREVIDIGAQVAEALDAAHSRGIVHRDIKPGNIVLGPRGQVKVLDFGLAKRFGQEPLTDATTSIFKTRTGFMIGTPHYMSPDQVLGRDLDGRTDIFSLGVVLYEAIVGQRPFLGKTVGEVMNNVVNQPAEALGIELPGLEAIVMKCLQKDPARRYASARELADDLQQLKSTCATPTPQSAADLDHDACVCVPAIKAGPYAQPRKQRSTPRTLSLAAAAVLVLLGLAAVLFYHRADKSKSPVVQQSTQKSVAVLPFDNFSGASESDYLSDGLTEEITAALSRIPGLKVAARNSAFTFKGKTEDARKIGQALGVTTLLEGSVRTEGKRLRVSAQLINVATGYHLWSETYDRSLDDILAVQQEIADRIAEKLQGKPTAVARRAGSVDPEAYTAYLQARLFWNQRNASAFKRAVQLFQTALEKDPSYAQAHAGLAATFLLIPEYVYPARHSEYRPLAKASAQRALQLDPNCAEAHAVLAMLLMHPNEPAKAEEHFQRAIQLDPNNAVARHWYGNFLLFRERYDESLTQYKLALDLDPLSPVAHSTVAQWYYYKQDYAQAVAEARKVIEKFPSFVRIREICILAMIQKGDFSDALKATDEARSFDQDSPLALLEYRAFSLARLGRQDEAREIQTQFEDALKNGQPAEGRLAFIYAGLREYDKLIDMLELKNAAEGLDPMILKDPLTRDIRDLPRFKSLIQRAGLTPQAEVRG